MADTKISALAAKTTPGAGDLVPIVDVSDTSMAASGTDKFVTYANLVPSKLLYAQIADGTVANTTTETTLSNTAGAVGSLATPLLLPANFFTVGKTLRVRASGYYSTGASGPNLQIRVKLGTTVVSATVSLFMAASLTNKGWSLEVDITCRTTGASGTISVQGRNYRSVSTGGTAPFVPEMVNTAPVTLDTTSSQAADVLATWTLANASDSITCTNLTVEASN